MKTFVGIAVFGLVLSVSSLATAQEASTVRTTLEDSSTFLPKGITPLLGFSTGYMSPGEAQVEGLPSSIKLIGSYYSEARDWVADAGLGFQYQIMNRGSHPFRTNSELAWRYRWSSGWQLGPVMNTMLHEGERYGSANRDFVSFIGAQLLKEFRVRGSHWRAGISAMTDMDIRNDVVNTLFAHLHITLGDSDRSVVSTSGLGEESVAAATKKSAEASSTNGASETSRSSHLIEQAKRQLESSARGVSGFGIGKTELTAEAKTYLSNVAALLMSKDSGIQKISVVGHADKTGTEPINQRVSAARARAAAQYLLSRGVPKSVIEQRGRSSHEPISDELAANRRVEIRVLKAKDTKAAIERLKAIQ